MFGLGIRRSGTVPGRGLAARSAFVAVGAAYVLLQVIATNLRRAPSWDEAIYLSQMWRGTPALPFAPSRARGVALLVAPISYPTASVTASRIVLMLAAAVMLGIAFAVWAPVVGRRAAVAAAALFGGWWVSLYYGSAVMPNLWSALLGVALVGAVLRSREPGRWPAWAAAAGAGMALVRPPDAVVLLGALLLASAFARPVRGRALLWPGVGVAAGSLVWLVEMSVRFGGPGAATRDALTVGHVSAMSLPQRLMQQLAVSDGPTLGPVTHPTVPFLGALWWAAVVVLAALGLRSAGRSEARVATRVAAVTGIVLIGVYVLLISGIAPRFLLPGLALLSLPAGAGIVDMLWAHGPAARAGWATLLAVLLVWNVTTARQVSRDDGAAQGIAHTVGLAVRDAAAGRPCAVVSTDAYPEVAFAAGCLGAAASRGAGAPSQLAPWLAQGRSTFVVAHGAPFTPGPFSGMGGTPVVAGVPTGWSVVRVSRLP